MDAKIAFPSGRSGNARSMKRKPRLVEEIEHEIDSHTAPSHPGDRKYTAQGSGDSVPVLRDEQEDEVAHGPLASGAEHMTTGQWKGMLLGGAAGAVIGALLLLPLALVPFMDSGWARVGLVMLAGALAGMAAGGVYWGGRMPELEGETMDADGRPSSGTTLRDPGTDERGR
jgi:hypothetical protein